METSKNEGNKYFLNGDYKNALYQYNKGISLAEKYSYENEGMLPFKQEIGESPKLEEGIIYY